MARSQSVNGSGNQSLAVDYGLVDSHGARAPRLRDDEDERSIYVHIYAGYVSSFPFCEKLRKFEF